LEFWRKPLVVGGIGVLVTIVLVLLVIIVLRTGDAKAVSKNAALLGALVGLGGVFSTQMATSALEDQRRREARDIEEQRVQEAALQQYFEQMGQLLRDGLHRGYTKRTGQNEERDEEQALRGLGKALTLGILRRLHPQHKWLVLGFLYTSELIHREAPIIDLRRANLREAILCEYLTIDKGEARKYLGDDADPSKYLSKDDLSSILQSPDDNLDAFVGILQDDRKRAALAETSLPEAILIKAYMRSANLRGADLSGASLPDADLIDANLSNACLARASLRDAVLLYANLNGSILNGVHSHGATFVKADLAEATLCEADLTDADLRRANLSGADLSGANLNKADLRGGRGWTEEQLLAANSLEGARMPDRQVLKSDDNPDGPTLEDWLKSQYRISDGENSGPS
jgi:uncharacterized protein YjbI with pentapeptide repeats